ncbi:MAG: methionyl-tRNA formyltransferase [Planctomycetota bacterium]
MKIIVMGTGPFAVPSAAQILQDGHEIPLVVTRPLPEPPPKKLPPRPVFDWANENGIPLFEPPSVNDPSAIVALRSHEADIFFVCDYGQILSSECLEAAKLGGINLHGSILPRHRGAAPVQWSLLRGDTEAGVTVIHMTPRLDAGPALRVAKTAILEDEDAGHLEPRLAEIGVAATQRAVEMLSNWDGESSIGEIQDKSLVTRAPRFAKSDGALDFRLPAEYLVRLVRACQPWPGTFAELIWPDGKKKLRVIVRSARALSVEGLDLQPGKAVLLPDRFVASDSESPWREAIAVGTGDGVFVIGRIQPAGKREMDTKEFLRGHQLVEGCQFLLPDPAKEALTE